MALESESHYDIVTNDEYPICQDKFSASIGNGDVAMSCHIDIASRSSPWPGEACSCRSPISITIIKTQFTITRRTVVMPVKHRA